MEMRSYTRVWRLRRRLAHVQGVRLPVQWTFATIGLWLLVQGLWAVLLAVLFGGPGIGTVAYWVVPPAVTAGVADRVSVDGRSAVAALAARAGWAAQPRRLHTLHTPARTRRGQRRIGGRTLWVGHGPQPQGRGR